MRAAVAFLLSLSTTGSRADPSQYLCIVDQSAGLHFDAQKREWRPRAFDPGRRYIFRRLSDDDLKGGWAQLLTLPNIPKQTWGLFEFGEGRPLASCHETGDPDISFVCNDIFAKFEFDKTSHRFETADIGGYTSEAVSERMDQR